MAGARPQVSIVGTGVGAPLVEAYTRDLAIGIRLEFNAHLEGTGIRVSRNGGLRRVAPQTARTRARDHRYGNTGPWNLKIAAIVNRTALDCHATKIGGRPRVAPACAAGSRMPGRSAVNRHLDAAN